MASIGNSHGGGFPEDKGGCWDGIYLAAISVQLTTNINAFFKKARQKISSNRYSIKYNHRELKKKAKYEKDKMLGRCPTQTN